MKVTTCKSIPVTYQVYSLQSKAEGWSLTLHHRLISEPPWEVSMQRSYFTLIYIFHSAHFDSPTLYFPLQQLADHQPISLPIPNSTPIEVAYNIDLLSGNMLISFFSPINPISKIYVDMGLQPAADLPNSILQQARSSRSSMYLAH